MDVEKAFNFWGDKTCTFYTDTRHDDTWVSGKNFVLLTWAKCCCCMLWELCEFVLIIITVSCIQKVCRSICLVCLSSVSSALLFSFFSFTMLCFLHSLSRSKSSILSLQVCTSSFARHTLKRLSFVLFVLNSLLVKLTTSLQWAQVYLSRCVSLLWLSGCCCCRCIQWANLVTALILLQLVFSFVVVAAAVGELHR